MPGNHAVSETQTPLTMLLAKARARLSEEEVRRLAVGLAAAPDPVFGPEQAREHQAVLAAILGIPERMRAQAQGQALLERLMSMVDRERERDCGLGLAPAPPQRLDALRAELARRGLDGLVIPRTDRHQGEFIAARDQRLEWVSGFTGSAGTAVVLAERAALFVDGRYTLQVREEVDCERFEILHLVEQPPRKWIRDSLPSGARLGYDPWLHSIEDVVVHLERACEQAGGSLVALEDDPFDAVWTGRPPLPLAPVRPHDAALAGRESADKRGEAARALKKAGEDAVVVTALDSLAWLFNIRGGDVPFTPVTQGSAVLYADSGADLFLDPLKTPPELGEVLGETVRLYPPEEFGAVLDALSGKTVRIDPQSTPAWVVYRLQNAKARVTSGQDPCLLPKAVKNAVEAQGMRAAHRRDGAALSRFLAWFSREAPKGGLSERAAADKLLSFRRELPEFRGPSFETIAGFGPHGAIVHYRVTPESDRPIAPDGLFLLDSGGQYPDGTTDVTRTVAVGEPDAEQRRRFTQVLKGHIALARIRFPKGTGGGQLDILARRALWEEGLDYDHGTGHGVGSYLGVHEGPQRISRNAGAVALRPGMVLSNEPGYYKAGAYGIRIENLVLVTPVEIAGAEREMLGFETLTLAPIDRALIEPALLTTEERAWVDAYHARVLESLAPLLDAADRVWLEQAARPL